MGGRHSLRKALLLLGALTAMPLMAAPASAPNHLRVTLLSEYKALAPGRLSWIGIRFDIESGWHIYWKDPGDSGEPPSVEWELPAGLRAGAIRWPAPERIPDHTLVDYGYDRSVLLMAPIRTPPEIAARRPVEVAATVKYLVCKDMCIPGTAHVALSMRVSRAASFEPSESRALFLQTRSRWPKPAPRQWKVAAVATADQFLLTLHTGATERQAVFFPNDPSVIKNAAPQPATALPDGVRLTLQKSDLLVKALARLEGVVVLENKRAFVIDAPVRSPESRVPNPGL
jgi:DsbC/DsbD-like thiol-disulfide interchange protein